MAGGAGGAGDLGVADVSDQQVPEAVLALVLHRGGAASGARAPCARARAAPARPRAGRDRPSRPAHPPRTPCRPRRRPGAGSCAPARACPAGRRSAPAPSPAPPPLPAARGRPAGARTPPRKGVASRPLQQRPLRLRRQHRALEQRGDQPRGLLVGQRGEVDRRRVAQPGRPGRMLLLQLRTGRAQSTSSGTPCDQSARCSRKDSRASSAQCRSSNTSTVGPCDASPSRKRRQAVNDSSWEAGSAGAPDERSQARRQPGAGPARPPGGHARAWPRPPRASRTRGCRTPP